MAARKGSTPRGRQDRHPDVYSAPPREAAVPEHVREFQRGLFPILVSGDVEAFRRYLARWEEVIGDTADLGQLPLAEQRTLMSRLLRRPQLYNLPAWPADLADMADVSVVGEAAPGAAPGASARPASDWPRRETPGDPAAVAGELVSRQPESAVVDATPTEPTAPPQLVHRATEAEPDSACYQLDMLTGELVPVAVAAPRVTETATEYEAEPARPVKRRARRRRPPADLVQLALWPDERSGG